MKHTAKCCSTQFYKHAMSFCEARVLDANAIELSIKFEGPAFIEVMQVQIRNGEFTCQHTMSSITSKPKPKGLRCAEERQELTLDKERYRKGDVIKGRIYYERLWESTDPKRLEEFRTHPPALKVYGVFKTILK